MALSENHPKRGIVLPEAQKFFGTHLEKPLLMGKGGPFSGKSRKFFLWSLDSDDPFEAS